jgi:hypothetical protein
LTRPVAVWLARGPARFDADVKPCVTTLRANQDKVMGAHFDHEPGA